MDDFLDSCETVRETSSRVREAIEIKNSPNWEMHGWASNFLETMVDIATENNSNQLI